VICRTYKDGDDLCIASEVADTIYIVHEGQAQVFIKGAPVATLNQGFSIGTAEVLRSFREFTDSPAMVKECQTLPPKPTKFSSMARGLKKPHDLAASTHKLHLDGKELKKPQTLPPPTPTYI
jgi:hypothetical protein